MQTINKIMLKEHKKLRAILKKFEENLNKNLVSARKIFNKFKWDLEKHFFIEEKVIFSVYNIEGEQENREINKLIKEHKDMLFLVDKIEENLKKGYKPDISILKKTLKIHEVFEDNYFYKKLDERLDKNQKQLIISRAKERIK